MICFRSLKKPVFLLTVVILILLFAATASATSAHTSKLYWQHQDGRLKAWYMDGSERVEMKALNPASVSSGWQAKAIADMDGDGHPDIYFLHTDGRLKVWLMDGLERVDTVYPRNPATGLPQISPVWDMMAVADLNGSGDPDIIWQALSGPREGDLAIWLMDGLNADRFGRLYNHPGVSSVSPLWEIGAVYDLLGDGQPEVIWQSVTGAAFDQLAYWKLDVAGDNFTRSASGRLRQPEGSAEIRSEWRMRTAVDLLGNGRHEILFQGIRGDFNGRVSYWEMTGVNRTRSGRLTPDSVSDPRWRLVGSSDQAEYGVKDNFTVSFNEIPAELKATEEAKVRFKVKNIGGTAGDQRIKVYVDGAYAAYVDATLSPGEEKNYIYTLKAVNDVGHTYNVTISSDDSSVNGAVQVTPIVTTSAVAAPWVPSTNPHPNYNNYQAWTPQASLNVPHKAGLRIIGHGDVPNVKVVFEVLKGEVQIDGYDDSTWAPGHSFPEVGWVEGIQFLDWWPPWILTTPPSPQGFPISSSFDKVIPLAIKHTAVENAVSLFTVYVVDASTPYPHQKISDDVTAAPPPSGPPAPALLFPQNNSTMPGTEITFQWGASPGAVRYILELAWGNQNKEFETGNTSLLLTRFSNTGTEFRWRVIAIDNTGRRGESGWFTFINGTQPPPTDFSGIEQEILNMVNQERTSRGLPALQMHSGLRTLARAHSKDMADHNFYSHVSPRTGSFEDRIRSANISFWKCSENITRDHVGDAHTAMYGGEKVVDGVRWTYQGWRNSPTHWANILDQDLTHIGIGVAYSESDGFYYYTQKFIQSR